ncbi:pre-mRNA processing factor 3 PRP3 [Nitzschia inconspicua]|uniref:Pre-mRNA processing factor 3 PRP3 n=1 Tax=Nitzschia inconspicua TaxID=303405 RepID=A0A9K3PM77_9STRA|nr:pre-mRNA processing factor 3 PRP3 [Nitzschia inconspicua]
MSAVEQKPGLNASDNANNNPRDNSNDQHNNESSKQERKRKRRWGDAAAASKPTSESSIVAVAAAATTATTPSVLPVAPSGPLDSKAKALALKASVAARLAALKAKTGASSGIPPMANVASSSLKRPPPPSTHDNNIATAATVTSTSRPVKRAKIYDLDMTVTGPTFRSATTGPPKPKINPYLAHRQQQQQKLPTKDDETQRTGIQPVESISHSALLVKASTTDTINKNQATEEDNDYVDARLEHATSSKSRRQRRELSFVEPGTFVEIAERKRQRALNAESAGFVSGRKAGQFVQSTSIMTQNYYGTTDILDAVTDLGLLPPRPEAGDDYKTTTGSSSSASKHPSMPLVVEWWDMELLPSKLKKQVANLEGKVLSKEAQSQMQHLSTKTTNNNTDHNDPNHENDASADDNNDLTPAIRTLISPEAELLRAKCMEQASLSYSKTAELIQHIVPIRPPHAKKDGPEAEPVLYLTKKELKRQRKRQREAKQRELQDLQAAGLIPAPEPRLTLQNFIRVLGDQAYVDPSQMEQKVMEQMQARQRAHLERNEARKLTKEQKAEKLRRKYEEDTSSTGVHVALFYVKNLSHPYHRTKVDLNAQQFNITGGVVECQSPQVACVIVEGGPKAIKKYTRLMLVRMKWKGPDNEDDGDDLDEEEEDDDEQAEGNNQEGVVRHKFDKENKCELVWTGMATKRFFKGFVFQACETSDQARKILRSKGVGHYWDQVLAQASGRGESMHLKLADSDDDEQDMTERNMDEDDDDDDDDADMIDT